MNFASREEAGCLLGERLQARGVQADVVIGLPRGGVVVAAEVARILERPLGVLVVRKIGHPRHREFAVGAMAEGDVVLLDRRAMAETHVNPSELNEIVEEEAGRLHSYKAKFHLDEQSLEGKTVVIVDDGLATGATAEAAVMSAKKQRARKVIVAVPVASPDAFERLCDVAFEVIALTVDPDFVAVGQYYQFFPQTTDGEVLSLLHPAHA